jgi:hypothetical protein
MRYLLKLFILSILITSCTDKKDEFLPSKYFDVLQQKAIVRQLIPRLEKRYTGKDISRQEGMDAMLLDSCYLELLRFDKQTERYSFLYIQKDIISEIDDARAIIGSFKLNERNEVISVYQDFITHRTLTGTTKHNGGLFFRKFSKGESLEEYIDKPDLIQWPNKMVKFDYKREKWVY